MKYIINKVITKAINNKSVIKDHIMNSHRHNTDSINYFTGTCIRIL